MNQMDMCSYFICETSNGGISSSFTLTTKCVYAHGVLTPSNKWPISLKNVPKKLSGSSFCTRNYLELL